MNDSSPICPDTRTRETPSLFRRVVRPGLFVVGLCFYFALVYRSRGEVLEVLSQIQPLVLLFSIIAALLYQALFSMLFWIILRKYGVSIGYPLTGHMFFYGQVAKYIPGHFWSIFYHASFLKKRGSTSAMLYSNVELTIVSIQLGIAIAISLMLYTLNIWLALAACIFGLWVYCLYVRSCITARLARFIMTLLKVPSDRIAPCSRSAHTMTIIVLGLGMWISYIAANLLLMKSLFDMSPAQSAPFIAAFIIAWVLGQISFIFPAGMGIREIAFLFLCRYAGFELPNEVHALAVIAITYRIWHMLIETGGLGVGFILSRVHKRNDFLKNEEAMIGDAE